MAKLRQTEAPPTLTLEQRVRLRALLDAIPRPLPTLAKMDDITEPAFVAALDEFGGVWLQIWRAWQYEGGPHPPEIVAYHYSGGGWAALSSADDTLAALYALTGAHVGEVG